MKNSLILYKYRNWNDPFHKNWLTKNELYFSSPDDMNDPFDFKIPADFSLLNTDDKIRQYGKYALDSTPENEKLKYGNERKFLNNYVSFFKKNRNQFQSNFNKKQFERTNKHFGILCFSERWDSILMWAHYANNSKGFCLGFHKQMLIDKNYGSNGPVMYKDSFPPIDPLEQNAANIIITQSHTKAKDWEYEEEYRFSTISYPHEFTKEKRIFHFPDEFLSEIILGLNIPTDDAKEIIAIGAEKNLPVYKIIKKPKSFIFERKRLLCLFF